MLRVGTTVLGVEDLHRAIAFWRAALGYELRDGEPGPDTDFAVLVPPDRVGPGLGIMVSESVPEPYPRVHLDLYTDSAAEQEDEVERLVSLGALRVDWDRYPESPDFVVLADPDGNRFCIADTSHEA